ncbi:uncharacterized protein LOC144086082 [Stigmatopora argus]
MLLTVFQPNGALKKTMKGADKAIVAKSFGKWESGSLRSRTVEKPDEPSEESDDEKPSRSTCEDPQVGKKTADKRLAQFTAVYDLSWLRRTWNEHVCSVQVNGGTNGCALLWSE